LDFGLVRITFRMLLASMPVREFSLFGPEITLDEAKRI
jgi:hypothetical protein